MTLDSMRITIEYWKKKSIVIFYFSLIGCLLGLLYWYVIPQSFSAISIVRIVSIENGEEGNLAKAAASVADVITLEDFISTPQIAQRISQEVGDPEMAKIITSYRYGGLGQLTLKLIPNSTLVQLRISGGKDKDIVLATIKKAAEFIIHKHGESLNFNISSFEKEENNISAQIKRLDSFTSRAANSIFNYKQKNTSENSSSDLLLESNYISLERLLFDLRITESRLNQKINYFRDMLPLVFVPATLEKQIISTPIVMGLIGAIIGFLISILIFLTNDKI